MFPRLRGTRVKPPTRLLDTRPRSLRNALPPFTNVNGSRPHSTGDYGRLPTGSQVGNFPRGERPSVGDSDRREDESEQQEKGLTAEEASRRIDALRHVYTEGYIARTTFETMVSWVKARARRSADVAGGRGPNAPK